MTHLLAYILLLAVALWVLAVVWRVPQEVGPPFPGPGRPRKQTPGPPVPGLHQTHPRNGGEVGRTQRPRWRPTGRWLERAARGALSIERYRHGPTHGGGASCGFQVSPGLHHPGSPERYRGPQSGKGGGNGGHVGFGPGSTLEGPLMLQERIFHLLQEVAPDFRMVVHTQVPGVVLPEYLMNLGELDGPLVLLQFGSGLARPPEHVDTDVAGLWATLSFQARPFRVFIPWASIVALGVPDRMDVGFKLVDIPGGPSKPSDPAPQRGHLRVVK